MIYKINNYVIVPFFFLSFSSNCFHLQNIRKLFRPLIRQIHPDLNGDAPKHLRELNAKSLAELHAFIDTVESNKLKLSPRYDLTFGIKTTAAVATKRSSESSGTDDGKWIIRKSSMVFPTSIIRASVSGKSSATTLQMHIQNQIDIFLQEIEETAAGTDSSKRKKKNSLQQSKRINKAAAEELEESSDESEKKISENFKNMLRYMAHREAILPAVKTFLEYLYGLPPGSSSSSSHNLRSEAASISSMNGDAAEAAYHLAALFRSGRILVDRDLSISEGTLALRRFGLICFKYHRQLQLTHPVRIEASIIFFCTSLPFSK
jgi:hypothetical protein